MSDNTTTVACINKQGSTQSTPCHIMARKIWDFAMHNNIWLSAAHCPGVQNCEADEASRKFQDETEWELNKDIFDKICMKFGTPTIDLFASRLNHKVPTYCSWHPDPDAVFIDALLMNWGGHFVYGFPPFSIIPLMLQKFVQDQAEGILVVPVWPTKPWFTQCMDLVVDFPLIVQVTDNVLFQSFSMRQHPLKGKLRLMVALCSTRLSRQMEFRNQLSRPCFKDDDLHQIDSISHTYQGGPHFVSRDKSIPFTPL